MNASSCSAMAALVVSLTALAGCASAPPSVLLSLPAASATSAATVRTVTPSMQVLAVGRIEVPEYLVSRRVRYKIDSSTVGEWPETYWAERIEIGMARQFNAALQKRLPDWRVCEANCTPQGATMSLQLAIVQLDYVRSEKRLVGKVVMHLEDTGSARQVLRGEERDYQVAATGDTAQAQAQALTDLLGEIANDAATLSVPAGQY